MKRLVVIGALVFAACPSVMTVVDAGTVVVEPDAGVDAGSSQPHDAGPSLDAGLMEPDGGTLTAVLGPDVWSDVDVPVRLNASGSTGADEFEFGFGDGSPPLRSRQPVVQHTWRTPGRYHVVLTAFDRRRRFKRAEQLVAVTFPRRALFPPSSTIVIIDGGVAVAVTDADSIARVVQLADGGFVRSNQSTCDEPVSLAPLTGAEVAVACRSGIIEVENASIDLRAGSRPVAIVRAANELSVALNGLGRLASVSLGSSPPVVRRGLEVADPAALAVGPLGFAVSRFRSIADGGLVTWSNGDTTTLAIDPQPASDTELGGTPNLLGHLAYSPDGRTLVVSSLQANILEGSFRAAKPLTFETTVRAVTSFIDVATKREQFDRRKQWDQLGRAGAIAFSPHGDFLYIAMPANGAIERYDMLNDSPAGEIAKVGADIRGLAVSDDGRLLYADAQLSREVVIYDVSSMGALPSEPIARVRTVMNEPLPAQLLLGKKLFNDASDPRLTREGYIACSHCHPDGDEDGIVWDFTDRGEGLRNTLSLLGRHGSGDGPIHWSGNFDEVQDFEGDIRNAFGGTGLLSNADWAVSQASMGPSKAGRSADLDALAAYVTSLGDPPALDGGLSPAAARGRAVFERSDVQCATCHVGPRLTDSHFIDAGVPLLHDVGTLTPASGKRLNGTLTGIDTPSLIGFWRNPPFLHDGSARTIGDVLGAKNVGDRHGRTSTLTAQELADLEAFLRSL